MMERKEKIKFPVSLTWKNFCPKSKYGKQFSQTIDKAVWVKHQRENFLDDVVIWYPLFNSTRSMTCHRKTPPQNPKQQKREKVWPLFCQQKKKNVWLLQQANQSPDLIIFTVLVQRRRVRSRQRRWGTLCSLHVLWSDGLGFQVHQGVNSKSSRDHAFWCTASHHAHT